MNDNETPQIRNVVIFDGINEFNNEHISANERLQMIVNNALVFGGLVSLIERINDENGVLYIETGVNYTYHKSSLKNVSIELFDLWNQTRP